MSATLSYASRPRFQSLQRTRHHALADMMVPGWGRGTAGPGDTQDRSRVFTSWCLFSMVAHPGQSFLTLVKHAWNVVSLIPNSVTEQCNLDQAHGQALPVLWPWSAYSTSLDLCFLFQWWGGGIERLKLVSKTNLISIKTQKGADRWTWHYLFTTQLILNCSKIIQFQGTSLFFLTFWWQYDQKLMF